MRYGIIAIIVLAIFGGAIFFTQRGDHPQPTQPIQLVAQQPAPIPAPLPNLNTYTNDEYKFSLQYPSDWDKYNPNDPEKASLPTNYFQRFGQAIIAVEIPQSDYPKTNFSGAFINFAVNTVYGNDQNCAEYTDFQTTGDTSNPFGYRTLTMNDSKTLAGTAYHYAERGGAAAGTIAETRIYRVLRNGMCYEVNLNLFTSNIGNYEPGTITAVNEAAVWKRLEDVLATMKFQ